MLTVCNNSSFKLCVTCGSCRRTMPGVLLYFAFNIDLAIGMVLALLLLKGGVRVFCNTLTRMDLTVYCDQVDAYFSIFLYLVTLNIFPSLISNLFMELNPYP